MIKLRQYIKEILMADQTIRDFISDRYYNARVMDDINLIKDKAYIVFNLWSTIEEYTKYNTFDPSDPKEFDIELYVPNNLVEHGEYMIDYIRVILSDYVDIVWEEEPLYIKDTCQMLFVINGIWDWTLCPLSCKHKQNVKLKKCINKKSMG